MRGRTNVTQRKAQVINGDLISATVEANDSINVGDFVEYRIDYAETATSDYNVSKLEELETTNYKILLISKNSQCYLELWKKSTQKRVDSIVISENGPIAYMDLVDNTHLIVYSPSDNIFYYVTISSNSFTITQSLTFTMTPKPTAVCVFDSSHFGAFVKESGSSNYNMKAYLFTFSASSITNTGSKSFSLGYPNTTYASYVKKVANDRIMLFGLASSYGRGTHLISFDNSYNFTSLSYISTNEASERLKVNDTMFAFLRNTIYLTLVKYDSTNDAISLYLELNLSTIFGSFDQTNGRADISLLNENQIAIYGCLKANITTSKRECVILTYDETQDTYSISEKIEVASAIKFSEMKFVIADVDDAKLITNASLIKLKIQDNEFEHIPDENYVKSYTGGKAIGFAKTAGVGGDSIRIYVPVV